MKIKVRAWTGKRMLYKGLHDHSWYDSPVGGKHVCEHNQRDENRYKTMLWSGRVDRNDCEIYEGDIDESGDVVVIDEHSSAFRIGRHWMHGVSDTLIEIVGNVYQTPERAPDGFRFKS